MYGINVFAGLLIKQAREERGWDQQYLADELDIDLRTLRKIEEGKTDMGLPVLNGLIHTLGISPRILCYGEQSDVGLRMDKVYRQLLQFSCKDIKIICDSALHVRAWKDSCSPDSDTADHPIG